MGNHRRDLAMEYRIRRAKWMQRAGKKLHPGGPKTPVSDIVPQELMQGRRSARGRGADAVQSVEEMVFEKRQQYAKTLHTTGEGRAERSQNRRWSILREDQVPSARHPEF